MDSSNVNNNSSNSYRLIGLAGGSLAAITEGIEQNRIGKVVKSLGNNLTRDTFESKMFKKENTFTNLVRIITDPFNLKSSKWDIAQKMSESGKKISKRSLGLAFLLGATTLVSVKSIFDFFRPESKK